MGAWSGLRQCIIVDENEREYVSEEYVSEVCVSEECVREL